MSPDQARFDQHQAAARQLVDEIAREAATLAGVLSRATRVGALCYGEPYYLDSNRLAHDALMRGAQEACKTARAD